MRVDDALAVCKSEPEDDIRRAHLEVIDMAWTRRNPNGVEDGMVVRKVTAPSSVFRVSGNPDAGRATFVAMSKGERTVLNGNARNYRPETADEKDAREGDSIPTVDEASVARLALVDEPESSEEDDAPNPVVAELCARLHEVVAATSDGTCSASEAAAVVVAAAELNQAVLSTYIGDES